MEPQLWLSEKLVLNPKASVRLAQLYSLYEEEIYALGLIPIGPKRFDRLLRESLEPSRLEGKVMFLNRSGVIVKGVEPKLIKSN